MEGKAALLKRLAGLDCFYIEINECDPKILAQIIKAISPTFGGINLEDIKVPECFEVEKILAESLDILVMHDDQHGRAITTVAALSNALWLVKKRFEDIRVVVHGAGAGAIATAKLLLEMGVKGDHILMFDSKGLLHSGREDLNIYKSQFATNGVVCGLEEAMQGVDVFLGFSVGNVLKPAYLMGMATRPIVFALS